MKRTIFILGTLCLGLTLSAQPGIVSTRPANDQNGKVLTMEETILSRELAPENLYCTWAGPQEVLMNKDGKWLVWNIVSDKYSDYVPAKKIRSAYTQGQSL